MIVSTMTRSSMGFSSEGPSSCRSLSEKVAEVRPWGLRRCLVGWTAPNVAPPFPVAVGVPASLEHRDLLLIDTGKGLEQAVTVLEALVVGAVDPDPVVDEAAGTLPSQPDAVAVVVYRDRGLDHRLFVSQ